MATGGLGDEDIDVAVFRFTLGIPGFEDRLIPRVVGVAIGALLAINHVVGAQPTPDAQVCTTLPDLPSPPPAPRATCSSNEFTPPTLHPCRNYVFTL